MIHGLQTKSDVPGRPVCPLCVTSGVTAVSMVRTKVQGGRDPGTPAQSGSPSFSLGEVELFLTSPCWAGIPSSFCMEHQRERERQSTQQHPWLKPKETRRPGIQGLQELQQQHNIPYHPNGTAGRVLLARREAESIRVTTQTSSTQTHQRPNPGLRPKSKLGPRVIAK